MFFSKILNGFNSNNLLTELKNFKNVVTLDTHELKQLAYNIGTITKDSSIVFYTAVRNRSAALTVYIPDNLMDKKSKKQEEIIKNIPQTLKKLDEYFNKNKFLLTQRVMGENDEFTPICNFLVSLRKKEYARLAYMWGKTLPTLNEINPAKNSPQLFVIMIPEWHEKDRQILVFAQLGITIVLGSDYMGEVKKGFLRMAMWEAKKRGMLGLHAGSKIVKVKVNNEYKNKGMLLFGLSGTGKTTHSCHHHYLDKDEQALIVQDDVVFLKKDGAALGTEIGFFIKTDGLTKESQPVMWQAAVKPNAVFENVLVDLEGNLKFQDLTLTGNGRGIVQFKDMEPWNYSSINLPPIGKGIDKLVIFFITRRETILPPVMKLDKKQAAIAFMLGESIETSAGDPTKAGQSVRVVGTNPFIIGDFNEEGNIFYDILDKLGDNVEAYLLNTGGMGKGSKKGFKKIGIKESGITIREVLRETIKWEYSEIWNCYIPVHINGLEDFPLDPATFYENEEFEKLVNELKKEREEYMAQFKNLKFI